MSVELAGSPCPAGGARIVSGLDSNGNGALDDSEITGTQFVCDGAIGATGASGLTALMVSVPEAAGANCADGGSKVVSGVDANRNNVLDNNEITATAYACHGAAGATGATGATGAAGSRALVRVVSEAAGANCTGGGTRIEAGLDANDNGLFDDAVTSTAFVCNGIDGTNGTNGTNGTSGTNGHSSLIDLAAEPAGAHCANGGTKVTSGLDLNDDGSLGGADTITATSYVCNPATTGTLTWQSVTATSVQASANHGYIVDNPAQVVVTLPASPAVGDLVAVSGAGEGGWKIAQNSGQSIVTAGLPGTPVVVAGTSWTARASTLNWKSVASSSDGSNLVAAVGYGGAAGQIYTSTDTGVSWTARESNRPWSSVASSSDGSRLVAVVYPGQIYTSTDAGVTWTARESNRWWTGVASSSDGSKLVAVVDTGQIYTSTDSGVSWTARESSRVWSSVASSSDGSKLVATVRSGQIYTSTDSGVTWTARESNRFWSSVASSSDGSKLVATVDGGQIFTSNNSGTSWTARESNRGWSSAASSSDGSKLVAGVFNGQIYTSTDSGVTWTARESNRFWTGVASSSNGSKLVAVEPGGRIYTSAAQDGTTPGTGGGLTGSQFDAVTLQYLGNGVFLPVSFVSTSGAFSKQ